jgi:DNA-binding NarL/FixJ family response regulator
VSAALLADFVHGYQHRDLVAQRIATRGLEVAHQLEVVDPPALRASRFYNEFQRPHRLFDTVHIRTPLGGGGVARFWLTRERESVEPPDAGRAAMLRLVAPALRAGVATWRRLGDQRAALASLLDRMSDGVLLFDLAGVPVHANAHAARLLADDPEAARVRAAAQQAAWALGAARRRPGRPEAAAAARQAAAASQDVRTARRTYRLEATVAAEGLFGRDPTALVLVRAAGAAPLTDDALRARYGLTRQEVVVTRLMAEGLSNGEVAERLGVTLTTARNHAAHVLLKLGVGKRARIAPLLQGGAGE